MRSLAVVHLARRANGVAPLERFLASYDRHPAGTEHDLVVLFKGFADEALPREYQALVAGRDCRRLFVPDAGYDIAAYFAAARSLEHRILCFLNSFSVVLAPGWLAKLEAQLRQPGVGIAGATGSWLSRYSAVVAPLPPNPDSTPLKKLLLKWLPASRAARNLLLRPLYRRLFEPFPNAHVRTNAFLLPRDAMLALQAPWIGTKFGTHLFESGRRSLTRQLMAAGDAPVIVGRDGRGYVAEDWHLSNTFWQSDQANLLIADNQTELYRRGTLATRAYLAAHAWGERARPAPPQ